MCGIVHSREQTILEDCSNVFEIQPKSSGCQDCIRIINMDRKFSVRIFADSRGAWLGHELENLHYQFIDFKVLFRKGASLIKLWEMVEKELWYDRTDLYIILGGVCDLTEKSYDINGKRVFWPHRDLAEIFDDITYKLEGMARNFRMVNHHSTLCFLPECGLDLIRYNQVEHPVPWYLLLFQESLEKNLRILQDKTKVINSSIGSLTPWSLEVTHAKRAGRLSPVFDRTYDGLHFSPTQVRRLAYLIGKFAENVVRKSTVDSPLSDVGNVNGNEHGNGNQHEL